jgi:uncharacterized repeat protein (TIGR01451 family)
LVGATLVAAAAFGVVFVAATGAAPSPCPIPGNFEIDGDMTQLTCDPGADDWDTPNIGVQSTSQGGTYKTAGKDDEDPSTWESSGSTPDKTNFEQAYATSRVVAGHFYVFVAWERTDTAGTQGYAIEIDNSGSNVGTDGTPQPDRGSGGSVFYISSQGSDAPLFASACSFTSQSTYGTTCTNSDASVTAAINTAEISDPLRGTTQAAGSFFEVALDITGLTGIEPSCPGAAATTVYLRSITGQTGNGNLKGYMAPLEVAPDSTCVPPPIVTTATPGGSSNAIGATQHDDVTVGTEQAPGVGSVDFFLCSPAEVTANGGDCSADGTQVGSATLDSNGQASSDDIDGSTAPGDNAAGTYCWRAEFTPSADDHNYLAGSHTNNDSECFTIVPDSPQVTTVADPSSAIIGAAALASVSDTATFTDGFMLDGRDASFTLYSDAGCLDATSVSGTASIDGGSATFTGDASGLAVGTYYWGVSLAADANNNAVSECGGDQGVENEVLSIVPASPSVSTVADPSSVVVGSDESGAVSDTATFSDGFMLDGRDATFTLYSDSGCSAATSVSGTATIGGGSATFTGDASSLEVGTYYWGVSLPADASNSGVSECGGAEGVENEMLSIEPASPSVTTVADPTVVGVGSEASGAVSDTATFTDGFMLDGQDAAFTLYSDPSCDPADATSVAGSATIEGGQATFTGDASGLSAGTYYWGVSYLGDNNNNAVSECGGDEGVENEILTIGVASPTIGTTLSASAGNVGIKVHDSAQLSGATPDAGGTVTYSVYSDATCSTKVADGGTVDVTDGSVPNSSDVTFNTPGTYYWQASYSGDPNNDPALSACTDEKLVIAPLIDLAITKAGSPASQNLGAGNITWTIVVTNNGPDTATGVTTSDPMPAGNTFVSVTTTQGTCTGGAILNCSLGTIAAGGTVTITLVTTPTVAATVTNVVTVVGNETETNTANNTASASVVVNKFNPPPAVFCVAVSKITPTQLFVGRKTGLTIHLTKHGKAVKGVRVLIKGPKLHMRTKPSNAKGIVKQQLKMKKAGIVTFTPIASKRCNTKRVGVTGVFTPPVTG